MKEFIDELYTTPENHNYIKLITILPNAIMLTNETYNNENNFDQMILQNSKYYDKIKEFMLSIIDINNTEKEKILKNFQLLENRGFNSFISYDQLSPDIKKAINVSDLIKKKYNIKYFDAYSTSSESIINDNKTGSILHRGVVELLILFNVSRFMAFDLVYDISDKDLMLYQTDGYIRNLLVMSDNDIKVASDDQLNLICRISQMTIDILDKLAKSIDIQINKNFNLMLFLSNKKKQFPIKNNECMTELHVNSASTHLLQIPLVKIFRSEEMIKILIHEIIHASGFDKIFGDIDHTKYSFKVNQTILFQEIIAETLAEYLNCLFYSKIHRQDFNKVLDKEIKFGLLQTAKILNHFNFKSMADFMNNKKDNDQICQTTAVFEYHILKTALLFNFKEFYNIIKNHGTADEILTLIIQTMQSESYQNQVDEIIKNLSSYTEKLLSTFRMSIIDIQNKNKIDQSGGNYYQKKYYKYKHKYLNYKKIFM